MATAALTVTSVGLQQPHGGGYPRAVGLGMTSSASSPQIAAMAAGVGQTAQYSPNPYFPPVGQNFQQNSNGSINNNANLQPSSMQHSYSQVNAIPTCYNSQQSPHPPLSFSTPATLNGMRPVTPSNTGSETDKIPPEQAPKKCAQFFNTIVTLVNNKAGKFDSENGEIIIEHIQKLVDGLILPSDFVASLSRYSKSKPQPSLQPFLEGAISGLRQMLLSGEVTIKGIRAPPPDVVVNNYPMQYGASNSMRQQLGTGGPQSVPSTMVAHSPAGNPGSVPPSGTGYHSAGSVPPMPVASSPYPATPSPRQSQQQPHHQHSTTPSPGGNGVVVGQHYGPPGGANMGPSGSGFPQQLQMMPVCEASAVGIPPSPIYTVPNTNSVGYQAYSPMASLAGPEPSTSVMTAGAYGGPQSYNPTTGVVPGGRPGHMYPPPNRLANPSITNPLSSSTAAPYPSVCSGTMGDPNVGLSRPPVSSPAALVGNAGMAVAENCSAGGANAAGVVVFTNSKIQSLNRKHAAANRHAPSSSNSDSLNVQSSSQHQPFFSQLGDSEAGLPSGTNAYPISNSRSFGAGSSLDQNGAYAQAIPGTPEKFRDPGDEDINDVAAMGGVNLAEESQHILASTSDVLSGEMLRCLETPFLALLPLQKRIMDLASSAALPMVSPEVAAVISQACRDRLSDIIEKLSVITEHRMDPLRSNPFYEPTLDVRAQVKFLEEVDKLETRRHEEREKEMIFKAAKSRSKVEDPEQQKLKEKAKELQKLEQDVIRNRDANAAAQLALGSARKKPRLDGPSGSSEPGSGKPSSVENMASSSGDEPSGLGNRTGPTSSDSLNWNLPDPVSMNVGGNERIGSSIAGGGSANNLGGSNNPLLLSGASGSSLRTQTLRPRIKRVNLRDLMFLMSQEPGLRRTRLAYRSNYRLS